MNAFERSPDSPATATFAPHSEVRAKALVPATRQPANGNCHAPDDAPFSLRDASGFEAVDADAFVRAVVARLRACADAKDVDVIVHCSCASAWLQPEPFSAALHALLANAIAASKRGHPVVLDIRDRGDAGSLWQIHDGGGGMPPEVLAEIGRVRRSTWNGAGLGVALAWATIERHGGQLRYESSVGVGTTASIWLPSAD